MSIDASLVLEEVVVQVRQLFVALDELAARTARLVDSSRGRAPTSASLEPLEQFLTATLAEHEIALGTGVVLRPGVVIDRPRELYWFWRPPGSPVQKLELDLDPRSSQRYDYTTTEWYQRGIVSRSVTGPYVDYLCTNDYVLTLTTPIGKGDHCVGLAGVDVLVSCIEELVLPRLLAVDEPVAVVAAEGRVVCSTCASMPPGAPISRRAGRQLRLRALPEAARTPLPWTVLVGDVEHH